jgi:hypothetical protein
MSMKHYDIMLRYKLFVTARVLLFISALPNEADGDVVKAACNIEIRSVMEWMDGVSRYRYRRHIIGHAPIIMELAGTIGDRNIMMCAICPASMQPSRRHVIVHVV